MDTEERYKLVRRGERGGMWYCKDIRTGKRESLKTRDRKAAARLVQHKNEALANPLINRRIGMTYLSAADPKLASRTWADVMADIVLDKTGKTLHRYQTAMKDKALDLIRQHKVVMTLAEDFLAVLRAGTVSTNVYLRRLQNHCLDLGWLPIPILPKKKFPKIKHKEKRAVTLEEHSRILTREGNPERHDFYELCWHFGGSQSDIASLQSDDLDYERRCFVYDRLKTGNMGGMRIGDKAWEVILRRPRHGPLFPYLITVREADRATEFKQRCEGLDTYSSANDCDPAVQRPAKMVAHERGRVLIPWLEWSRGIAPIAPKTSSHASHFMPVLSFWTLRHSLFAGN